MHASGGEAIIIIIIIIFAFCRCHQLPILFILTRTLHSACKMWSTEETLKEDFSNSKS